MHILEANPGKRKHPVCTVYVYLLVRVEPPHSGDAF